MGKKGGAYSRRKGHNFEREIANQLKPIFPKVRRQLEYHWDDCRGVDLMHTGEYRFQCKKLKRYASIATIDEVQYDRMVGEVPVLVTAGDGLTPMAVLPFEDFLQLLKDSRA